MKRLGKRPSRRVRNLCIESLETRDLLTSVVHHGIEFEWDSFTTNEKDGGAFFIKVRMLAAPAAPVEFPVSTSNPDEGVVNTLLVRFDATNWSTQQNIGVSGVNDEEPGEDDGDVWFIE
jgi:hypothetical protein